MTPLRDGTPEAQEYRAAQWFGLRPSRARICPRVVAGKRCIDGNLGKACVCHKHHDVFDHARIWLDETGRHVFTAEPYSYSASGEEIAAMIADMAALGLEVRFSGRSPYNPGYTLLIKITKQPNPKEDQ